MNMNKQLQIMDSRDLERWLKSQLKNTWSKRDIKILAEVLFDQYQSNRREGKSNRYDREYFAKMLVR